MQMPSSIKIASIPSASYAEVSQKSDMRWAVVHVNEEGVATGQHGWWKCKDFLNDSVIFLATGREFPMYGYQNKLTLNEEGAFVALKNIPDFFKDNLAHLNHFLAGRDMPPISWVEHDKGCKVEAVIIIPTFYWESTFTISAITSMIRSCVYKKISSMEEGFAEEPTLKGYIEKLLPVFVVSNRPIWKGLLFKNYQYDGSTKEKVFAAGTTTIHNCGLQSWLNSGAFK
jgi:hypothetical protein